MSGHVGDLWKRKDGTKTPLYGKGLRWRVIYDDGGKRRSKSFRTQDQARAFLTSVDHKQRSGEYIPQENRKALIGDLLPAWEASLIRLKPSTREQIKYNVRATVGPKWNGYQIGKVERTHIQQWIHDMHEEGAAPRTVQTRYGTLRSFYTWAVKEGHVGVTPCTGITLPRGHSREHIYLNPAQVRALLEAMDDHYRPLVEFLITTGARFGEAIELRVKDLDLDRRRAAIARSHTHGHTTLPKTHKRRSVPLTGPMVDTLRELTAGKDREALVFTSRLGFRVQIANFRKLYWWPAVERAGVPKIRVHDARHTSASLAVSSGANVKAVQKMLGHASASQTLDTYSGLFSEDLDAVAERMESLLYSQEHTTGTRGD